jgi:hypothetical protein
MSLGQEPFKFSASWYPNFRPAEIESQQAA